MCFGDGSGWGSCGSPGHVRPVRSRLVVGESDGRWLVVLRRCMCRIWLFLHLSCFIFAREWEWGRLCSCARAWVGVSLFNNWLFHGVFGFDCIRLLTLPDAPTNVNGCFCPFNLIPKLLFILAIIQDVFSPLPVDYFRFTTRVSANTKSYVR